MMSEPNAPTDLDSLFVALSDATRRKILDRLSKGEARVTELAAGFPISLNSVSKHIRLLERAQLVERRVVGRDHFLRIQTESLDGLYAWVEQKRSFWKAQLSVLDDVLTRATREVTQARGKRGKQTA